MQMVHKQLRENSAGAQAAKSATSARYRVTTMMSFKKSGMSGIFGSFTCATKVSNITPDLLLLVPGRFPLRNTMRGAGGGGLFAAN